MIYLPWIAFLLGILWMIREGSKSKNDYMRRREIEEKEKPKAAASEDGIAGMFKQDRGQSHMPDLAETLGGRSRTGGSAYGSGSGFVS